MVRYICEGDSEEEQALQMDKEINDLKLLLRDYNQQST